MSELAVNWLFTFEGVVAVEVPGASVTGWGVEVSRG